MLALNEPDWLTNTLHNYAVLDRKRTTGLPMQRKVADYWRTNIYETTAGNFWTELMDFHSSIIGEERILYSVDYPFVMMQQGAAWVESLPYSEEQRLDFVRNRAVELLKLDQ